MNLSRTYATFMKQWPGRDMIAQVTSPDINLADYENTRDIIDTMVGDLERIIVYPSLGYQIFQQVPEDVLVAFEHLKECGFVNHLLK